jgi:hypothetical protein
MPAMPTNRCYFLDREDHIGAAADIEAAALSEAVAKALGMLKMPRNSIISRSGRARIASTPSPPPIKWLLGNVLAAAHAAAHVPSRAARYFVRYTFLTINSQFPIS